MSVRPRDATLCFEDATAFDLVDGGGRKLVGSAQRRRAGRVLHHGSLPLSVPPLSPGSGALDVAAGRRVSWDEVAAVVEEELAHALGAGFEETGLTGSEERRADELSRSRYVDLRTTTD